jgi:phosphatidylinositol glycan class B
VLHAFLTDRSSTGVLNRSLAVLALFTISTAWVSDLFFWPDEHWQVLEFLGFKLGITPAAELPWEFASRVRSWMQPFLYWLIAKPLIAAGLTDMFKVVFVLRLATGALSFAAIAAFARLFQSDLARSDEKFAFARMLPFMGFLPYLFVRTASETAAAAFFTLGLVMAVRAARNGTLARMALAGLLCGIAFECRFQSALLTFGLFGWLIFQARIRPTALAVFTAGGLAVVAFATLVDHWGYGVWCFPPWTYFDLNILQGIAAKGFGSSPLLAYFYLEPVTIFAPITILLMVAMVIACARNLRHVVTWATVPFFLVHCLMAHKEERFLFPLAILAISWPVLAFAPGRPFKFFNRFWAARRGVVAKIIGWSAVVAMAFLAVYPFGLRPHMKMAKYLYRSFPAGLHAYSFDAERFDSYPMVRPTPYRVDILFDRDDLNAALAKGPVYLFSDGPFLPSQAAGTKAHLAYSEFPLADNPSAAAWAEQIARGTDELKRKTSIHPPKLRWLTLYRIER